MTRFMMYGVVAFALLMVLVAIEIVTVAAHLIRSRTTR